MDLAFAQTEFTLANNTNYQIAQNFNEQRQLELKLEKSKALPSMYANVNFGYNAFNNKFAFFTENQKQHCWRRRVEQRTFVRWLFSYRCLSRSN